MAFAHSETPEHVRTTIGAVLRRRREAVERSLQDVAGPAGISPAYLSEVERGRKEISVDLRRMMKSLDVETLRTVAHFTNFLSMNDGAGKRRPIGFMR